MTTQRRRGAELEQAILSAVLEQVTRHGYANTTYEGVAAAAGTGKAVLYRRWPTKAEMIFAAFTAHQQIEDLFTADTGSLAGDLQVTLRRGRDLIEERRGVVLGVLADIDPRGTDWTRTLFTARIHGVLDAILAQARARGELGDSPLPPRVLALPLTLLRHDVLVFGHVTDAAIDDMIETCILPSFINASRA
ncbi:TetR/AcrR family transcriptional regulator [Gordonia sp. CPCC 206044]|uniref:TetR/AcrR family transcriptional regulator n=1 Tax=Gordonia sp. CPCC 206044 TaxID=3140793 RepID=UPI003AF341C2